MLKIIVAVVVVLVVLAAVFKFLRTATETIRDAVLRLLDLVKKAALDVAAVLAEQKRRALAVLTEDTPGTWTGARMIGSVIFGFAFIWSAVAEAAILTLVFAAWGYGTAPRFLEENSNAFIAVTLLTDAVFFGAVLLDLIGATNISPLGHLRDPWPSVMKRLVVGAMASLLTLLLLIGLWRGLRTTSGFELFRGELDAGIPVISQAAAAVLTGVALALASWGLKSLPISLIGCAMAILEFVCRGGAVAVECLSAFVRGAQSCLIAILRIPAKLGENLYNFVAALLSRWVKIEPIDIDASDSSAYADEGKRKEPGGANVREVGNLNPPPSNGGSEKRVASEKDASPAIPEQRPLNASGTLDAGEDSEPEVAAVESIAGVNPTYSERSY